MRKEPFPKSITGQEPPRREPRVTPESLLVLITGVFGLWWFFPGTHNFGEDGQRAPEKRWQFAPDVSLPGGSSSARSVAFSPDGHTVAVSTVVVPPPKGRGVPYDPAAPTWRYEVQLWDLSSRQRVNTLITSNNDRARDRSGVEIFFSPEGNELRFLGLDDSTWDTATGMRLSSGPRSVWPLTMPIITEFPPIMPPWVGDRTVIRKLRGSTHSADGLWYVGQFMDKSGGDTGSMVKLWHRTKREQPWQSAGTLSAAILNRAIIYDMALNRDGSILALSLNDGPVALFKTSPLRAWKKLPNTNWIIELEFVPKGTYLVGCGGDDLSQDYEQRRGVVNFWNIDSGVLEETATADQLLRYLVLSPNGRHVAAIEGDKAVFVCPLPVASKAPPLAGPQPSVPPTK